MKRKLNLFEIIWYALCAAAALTGLVFIVLGLIGQFGGKSVVDLRKFSTPGYICLIVGALASSIVLMIFAKTSDRASEAAARRAARLAKVETPSKSSNAD